MGHGSRVEIESGHVRTDVQTLSGQIPSLGLSQASGLFLPDLVHRFGAGAHTILAQGGSYAQSVDSRLG